LAGNLLPFPAALHGNLFGSRGRGTRGRFFILMTEPAGVSSPGHGCSVPQAQSPDVDKFISLLDSMQRAPALQLMLRAAVAEVFVRALEKDAEVNT
jgi:hypothetical protein